MQLGKVLEKDGINGSSGCIRIRRRYIGAQRIQARRMCQSRVPKVVCLAHCVVCVDESDRRLLFAFLAYIEGVRSVLDPNPMPPGLYQYSVVVSTPQREMKITAPTKERHDIWLDVCSCFRLLFFCFDSNLNCRP